MRDVSSARADVGSPRHDVVHDQMDGLSIPDAEWQRACDYMGLVFFALFALLSVGCVLWGW